QKRGGHACPNILEEKIMTLGRNIAIALIVVLAGTVAVRAQERFEKFTSGQGRFTVEMPGKPAESSETTPRGQMLHNTIVKSLIERYQVTYFDLPDNIIRNHDPQKLFKAFTSGEYPGNKLEKENTIAFGADKLPGLEYRVETIVKTDNGG